MAHTGLPHDAAHKVDGASPDTTPPRLSRTVLAGKKLMLAFDEAIDAAASLTSGAFTVKKTPPGGSEETVGLSGTPAIEGAAVTLTLAAALRGGDTGVKVSYRKPPSNARNRLRDAAGNEVASFSDQPVANTAPPRLVRGEIDGGTITVYFSKALDPDWTGGYFNVNLLLADGRQGTFTATGDVEVSGNKVTVELGEGRRSSGLSSVAFFYGISTGSGNWLRDFAGNVVLVPGSTCNVASGRCYFSTGWIGLADLTGPPKVAGVAVSSKAKADRTYALGETIQVTLTFSEAVTVTGTPRVKIGLGSGTGDERWADYAGGSGTRTLKFAYKVAQGDASTAGVAMLENTLDLNGGTIQSASAAGENATLVHAGLDHDPAHKVSDAPDSAPPTLSAARVNGTTLTLTFNENLGAAASLGNGPFTVKKTPQGGSEQDVSLSGTPAIAGATVTLMLANAVLETDTDVKVSYTKPTSGTGNRLRDELGNEVGDFANQPVKKGPPDTTPPRLVRGEVDGGTVTLYFNEPLDPDSVGGRFRATIRLAQSGIKHSFTPSGEIEISGNTVTVGLGSYRGQQRLAKAGEERGLLFYMRSTAATAKSLRDLAGNPVQTPHWYDHDGYSEWRSTLRSSGQPHRGAARDWSGGLLGRGGGPDLCSG